MRPPCSEPPESFQAARARHATTAEHGADPAVTILLINSLVSASVTTPALMRFCREYQRMHPREIVSPGASQTESSQGWLPRSPATKEKSLAPPDSAVRSRPRQNLQQRWQQPAAIASAQAEPPPEDAGLGTGNLLPVCCLSTRLGEQKWTTKRQQSGNMSPVLLPLHDGSKNRFEVLRLGSESAARRAENIHRDIPSTWIDSGGRASSPNGTRLGATNPRHARTNDAPAAQQTRTKCAPCCRCHDGHHPKPPGLGVGVLLWTCFVGCQQREMDHRISAGQLPDDCRTNTGQEPDKMRKL